MCTGRFFHECARRDLTWKDCPHDPPPPPPPQPLPPPSPPDHPPAAPNNIVRHHIAGEILLSGDINNFNVNLMRTDLQMQFSSASHVNVAAQPGSVRLFVTIIFEGPNAQGNAAAASTKMLGASMATITGWVTQSGISALATASGFQPKFSELVDVNANPIYSPRTPPPLSPPSPPALPPTPPSLPPASPSPPSQPPLPPSQP